MSDVSVPGFGKQKKSTVYVIGGIVVVVIGIGYYRSKKDKAATAATTSATTSDTMPAAGADTSGVGAYDSSAYGSGQYVPTGAPLNNVPSAGPTGYTSNSQWSQAAEEYLAGTVGLDATAVQAALGKYITGGNVTADQQNIIEQAIAAEGYPPQSGPNGYPPSVKLVATTPAPPTAPKSTLSGFGGEWIRNVATSAIYQVDEGTHTIYHLSYATAVKMQREKAFPKVQLVAPTDPRLKYKNGGNI